MAAPLFPLPPGVTIVAMPLSPVSLGGGIIVCFVTLLFLILYFFFALLFIHDVTDVTNGGERKSAHFIPVDQNSFFFAYFCQYAVDLIFVTTIESDGGPQQAREYGREVFAIEIMDFLVGAIRAWRVVRRSFLIVWSKTLDSVLRVVNDPIATVIQNQVVFLVCKQDSGSGIGFSATYGYETTYERFLFFLFLPLESLPHCLSLEVVK